MAFNPHAPVYAETLVIPGVETRTPWQTIRAVLPYLWPADEAAMRARAVIALACLVLGRSANVYGPIVLKDLVDALPTAASNAVTAGLFWLVALYGATVLLPGLLTEVRAAVFTPVSEYAQRVFGLRTFRHLHNLSMRFHLARRTGGLSRAIERGTRALQMLTTMFAFNIGPTLFEIGAVCLYLGLAYPLKYVAVILLAVALYIVFTLFYTEWRTRFRREMVAEESRATTIGVDSLLNFETVKYFNNQSFEADRYDSALRGYMVAAVKSQTTLGILNGGQLLTRVICQVMILWLAVADYVNGSLSLGEVVMLNTFMLQLFIPLGFLGSSYRMIRQALVDMEFMFQLLDLDPDISDAADATPLTVKNATVEFRDVTFAYTKGRNVLEGVSFVINAGTTTAVVGPSGAGKSTLSRLLFRFYEVDGGEILIDGQNVAGVTQASLRNAVGIVPQDTVLFNESIGYNIAYGRPGATPTQIREACELASILDFIEDAPDGFETSVGERGLKLSGGEKQRVSLARTVLKDPPVLVLDEATSALDMRTEREIQAALQQVSQNRTTLVIAHRLSTIVHADEILVLDKGKIIERGNHEALVARGGLYAEMWQKQKVAAETVDLMGDDSVENPGGGESNSGESDQMAGPHAHGIHGS